MGLVHVQRRLSDMHKPESMKDVYDQCRLADDASDWRMDLYWSVHALADVLPLANAKLSHRMSTRHDLYVNALFNAACR